MKSDLIYESYQKGKPYLNFVGRTHNSVGVGSCCAISPWHVLLADHLRQGDDDMVVEFIGEEPNRIISIENVYHGGDVAIGQLHRKTSVKRPSVHHGGVKIKEHCLVAGWGTGSPRSLRWGWSRIIGAHHTEGYGYLGWRERKGNPIVESGDSGGALLIIRNETLVLAGIIIGANQHARFSNNLALSLALLTQRCGKKGNLPKTPLP